MPSNNDLTSAYAYAPDNLSVFNADTFSIFQSRGPLVALVGTLIFVYVYLYIT